LEEGSKRSHSNYEGGERAPVLECKKAEKGQRGRTVLLLQNSEPMKVWEKKLSKPGTLLLTSKDGGGN